MTLVRSTLSSDALLYITTHLSQMEVFRFSNLISPATILQGKAITPSDGSSFLQKQISEHRKNFAAKHKLGRMTIIKTWGLASLDSYVATCITLHPSDQVEYRIPREEEAIIIFSSASLEDILSHKMADGPDIFFPWEAEKECKPLLDAYEATLITILTWPAKETSKDDTLSRRVLYNSIFAALIMRSMNVEAVLSEGWRQIIVPHILRQETYLFDMNRDKGVIQNLPKDSDDLPKALKVLNDYIRAQTIREATSQPQRRVTENCSIPSCGAALLWESLTMARCMAGHRWSM